MLPIAKFKEEIIEAVKGHDFTIISAEAGVGKSTQIPQYVADLCNQVIATEPRIIAAKTLAMRVANEMGAVLGEEVGYKTGLDKLASANSRILFCTDGYQLIKTLFEEGKEEQRVLIIDEAHEWTLPIEGLISICKYLRNEWNTKVIITSATIEVEELASFLGEETAVLKLPGKMFPVTIEEREEYSLLDTVIEKIRAGKNILVFEPGKKEISNLIEKLSAENATVLPLHGDLEFEEQDKCFKIYSNPKVIVATNIAQSSITVSEIDCVIDTGTAYIPVVNNGIEEIKLVEISQAEIEQRARRAGRTKAGEYYLCSDTPISARPKYPVPEIQRSILDKVVLQFESIGIDTEKVEFFHQPSKEAISMAKKELVAIGALDANNNITELGQKIAKMPIGVKQARMIIEAEEYGVTESVITIAAILENGGLLTRKGTHWRLTEERNSDLLAELDIWNLVNSSISKNGNFDFETYGISRKKFNLTKVYIKKLKKALEGIVEFTNGEDRDLILKSCLTGFVSTIYCNTWNLYDQYEGEAGDFRRLNINTCVTIGGTFVTGKPECFTGKNGSANVISFVSVIEEEMLLELIPDKIETVIEYETYNEVYDAVVSEERKEYAGYIIKQETHFCKEHPRYEILKSEYEERKLRREKAEMERKKKEEEMQRIIEQCQKCVMLEGKQYSVLYMEHPMIVVDDKMLFTTNQDEIFLDNGERVWVTDRLGNKSKETLGQLREIKEVMRVHDALKRAKEEYSAIKVNTMEELLGVIDKLGEVEITKNKGGYGEEPILAYVGLLLDNNRKKTVLFTIVNDKKEAEERTLEVLRYFFKREVEKKYVDNKFSHIEGNKKKILTVREKKMKEDFYSLVRELTENLTVENVIDNWQFLTEYYEELMQSVA